MGKFRARTGAAWTAWKKKHWDPEHGVGFHADSFFISPGRTVYPPLRRAARWLSERRDSIVEKVIVGACLGILAALTSWVIGLFHR